MKIQTSNFACRFKVRDTKPESKKYVKSGRNLLFKFWDSPNISGIDEDTNLKFCRHIDRN